MLNSISDSLKHLAKKQAALLSKFRSSIIHELSKFLYS